MEREFVWSLPELYRTAKRANEVAQIWIIGFNGEHLVSSAGTLADYEKGQLRSHIIDVELNSTGRNLDEQARQEANVRWQRKKDKDGYQEQLIEKDIFSLKAMLGYPWKPNSRQITTWPNLVMAKLDGVRCIIHTVKDVGVDPLGVSDVIFTTRGGKPIHHFNQLRQELIMFFPYMKRQLVNQFPDKHPAFRLDGEIFTTKLSFNTISGLSRLKTVPDPDEDLCDYYMFDLILTHDVPYYQRWGLLKQAYKDFVSDYKGSKLKVPITQIVHNKEEILAFHAKMVEKGYEGTIIRRGGFTEKDLKESYYSDRRCTAIYKYKDRQDAEFPIVGAKEATGDDLGTIVWECGTKSGKSFFVRPKANYHERKRAWEAYCRDSNSFLGQLYRVSFDSYTTEDQDIPRFPSGLGFVYDR
ncbi:MAG: ATP-dependent DNA ligase [Nitrososphaerales archaeon]